MGSGKVITRHPFLSLVVIFASVVLLTEIALASPDRRVVVSDRPIAFTPTHIFLLREIEDNLGAYNSRMVHQFLVSQSIDTGNVDQHWLVRRAYWDDMHSYSAQDAESAYVLEEPPSREHEGKPEGMPSDVDLLVNPYEILRIERAVPIGSTDISFVDGQFETWTIDGHKGILFNFTQFESQPTIRLSSARAIELIERSLRPSIQEMHDFEVEPSYFYEIIDDTPEDLDSCYVKNSMLIAAAGSPQYVNIACQGGQGLLWIELWLRLEAD